MRPDLTSLQVDSLPRLEVGPGCYRRDIPGLPGTRAWIVEIEPGCTWPFPDQHDAAGEIVLVMSGELIDGDQVFGPGSYITYGANSVHQPRSDTGVRLFGLNAA
ncbi:MAG TPA: cupin domain-containing protein [Rhodanobacteraceae bacterium]|nr:cupin domain-containing protein [Rhodanobacteraceae bacterium]